MGHPLLRQTARAVTPDELSGEAFGRLIADMVDTLHDYGGIGLAAPQIGVPLRVAIIEIEGGPTRYGELAPVPLTVFINPLITVLDPATAGAWEGCLSVPGLRGWVERPQQLCVDYLDIRAMPQTLEASGFLATVCQHEFDHLDGVLYLDRMTDMRRLAFSEEFERYQLGG